MTDTRFTTVFDTVADLLEVVDLDGFDQLESLLMALLNRPVGVREPWDRFDLEDDDEAIEVLVHGSSSSIGTHQVFPKSLIEIARDAAERADELGPYAPGVEVAEGAHLATASDDELIAALKAALVHVRLVSLFGDCVGGPHPD